MDVAESIVAAGALTTARTDGLTTAEARRLLETVGANALPAPRAPTVWRPLLRQLTHFFALMLWVATGLALVAGLPQLAVAIAIVVVVNAAFAFAQEFRADRAADRLRDLMPSTVAVRRDGRRRTVPAHELVPCDLVILEAGDRVCADLRAVRTHCLAVDESLLTGESVPRRPGVRESLFAGTFVVEGAAEAVVGATGTGTRLAAIAALTRRTRRPPSPLAIRINRVVGVVAGAAVGVGLGFFGVALLLGTPPMQGFLSRSGSPWHWCPRVCSRRSPWRWPAALIRLPDATPWSSTWKRWRRWARSPSSAPTRPAR